MTTAYILIALHIRLNIQHLQHARRRPAKHTTLNTMSVNTIVVRICVFLVSKAAVSVTPTTSLAGNEHCLAGIWYLVLSLAADVSLE